MPLELYEKFRHPLRGFTVPPAADADRPYFVEGFDENTAIAKYQKLITELPPLNRQLLLYILDLLAVFAAKSEENRMTSQNLAAIFQPGMLSHPTHAMAPEEYRLNQCVIIFLIENQDHFILGMQGTAADEETKKEVEAGTPAATPVTPSSSNRRSIGGGGGGVYRSSSNASAGAQSVRRDGQIRRNRSVNSRHSKGADTGASSSPVLGATQTGGGGGGLGRSNTVPSKKSPSVGSKFTKRRDNNSGAHSPSRLEPLPQAQLAADASEPSDNSSLAPPSGGMIAGAGVATAATGATGAAASSLGRSQERLLGPNDQTTPQKERGLQNLFQRSPTDESNRRQPNKLKKKRIPGSEQPSAQSSNTSLPHVGMPVSPSVEPTANPLENTPGQAETDNKEEEHQQKQGTPPHANGEVTSDSTPRASQIQPMTSLAGNSSGGLRPEDTPRAQGSPPASFNSSSINGGNSDVEQSGGEAARDDIRDKKSRWRLSRPRKEEGWNPRAASSDRARIRSNDTNDASQTSFASSAAAAQKSRKSFTGSSRTGAMDAETAAAAAAASAEALAATNSASAAEDSGRDEPKGPIGWIRNKYREAKENAEIRRNKSPTGESPHRHYGNLATRGKSMDAKRDSSATRGAGASGTDDANDAGDSAYLWAAAEKPPTQQPQVQAQQAQQTQPEVEAVADQTPRAEQTQLDPPQEVKEPQEKAEAKPEPQAESTSEPASEDKAESKPEAVSEDVPEAKPELDSQERVESKPEAEVKPDAEPTQADLSGDSKEVTSAESDTTAVATEPTPAPSESEKHELPAQSDAPKESS